MICEYWCTCIVNPVYVHHSAPHVCPRYVRLMSVSDSECDENVSESVSPALHHRLTGGMGEGSRAGVAAGGKRCSLARRNWSAYCTGRETCRDRGRRRSGGVSPPTGVGVWACACVRAAPPPWSVMLPPSLPPRYKFISIFLPAHTLSRNHFLSSTPFSLPPGLLSSLSFSLLTPLTIVTSLRDRGQAFCVLSSEAGANGQEKSAQTMLISLLNGCI
jgi:hypothetical protein